MGGKSGSTATNNQMVNMQMQQAAQSEEANAERNARLTQGATEINQMFQGTPSGSTQVNLSNIGLGPNFGGDPSAQGYTWQVLPDDGSGQIGVGLYSPQGALVTSARGADALTQLQNTKIYTGGDPNQTTGGFDQPFYNKYTQAQLSYYLPQEDQQYSKARTNLDYGLARAGQLNSSVANMDKTQLASQDEINQAQIAASADNQTAQLRDTIQQDQESALNQLYSTEDPSVAANTAGNMVANASLTKPILNPLGSLFSAMTVGIGNAMSGFTNPYAYINPSAGGSMGTAMTPSGAQSAGSNVT